MGKKRKSSDPVSVPAKKAKLSPKKESERSTTASTPALSKTKVLHEEMEVDFPRGGQDFLTPLEKRVIKQQATEEVLFSRGGQDFLTPLEKRVIKQQATEEVLFSQGFPVKAGRNPTSTDCCLSMKKLTVGTLVLGAVREINEYDVSVSLPFNRQGSLAITDISDPLTHLLRTEEEEEDDSSSETELPRLERLFCLGALLPCYVTSIDAERGRVSLSVNPRMVNSRVTAKDVKPGLVLPGWVKSVEDHGYIVDFGVEGKTGFLLKKNATEFVKSSNKGKPLCLGQVVQCLVLPGADARSVPITVNPGAVMGCLIAGDSLVALHSLLPGLVVNAAVKEVASNGLLMSFLGGFEGVVGVKHLLEGDHMTDNYPLKKKFKARVLWVNVADKSVGLTLQRQIVIGKAFDFHHVEIGDIFHDSKVVHIDHSSSLFLDLPNGVMGYAPLRLVHDEKRDSLGKEHRKGSCHSCRVVQFNLMDGVAIVSLQTSVLEKPYMKYSDVKIGDVIEGTVEKHGDFGMILGLTEHIRGICPKLHVSDIKMRKKLKEGAKVKCRVLNVVPTSRKLLLSCKKSLVRSPQAPLSAYAEAKPGGIHTGTVSSVHHYGCIVHFYGGVRGLVMRSELSSTQVIRDPMAVFKPGQTVDCKVLRCDPAAEKLQLSFKLDCPVPVEVSGENSLTPGSFVNTEVTGIASNGLNLRYRETGELAFLPTMHLSDFPHLCPQLLNLHQNRLAQTLKEGKSYSLEKVLVVCGKLSFRPALVTMKRSFHDSITTSEQGFPSTVPDLKPGIIMPGFIKKAMPYGCFVEFPHNLSGLAPSKYLTDEFISDPMGLYEETQSVQAKVLEVDESRGRFLLSLKPSDLKLGHRMEEEEVGKKLAHFFQTFLDERDSVLEGLAGSGRPMGQRNALVAMAEMFHPGKCVTGQVTAIEKECVSLELSDGVLGRATTLTAQGLEVAVGNEVTCCMLDLDLLESHIIVSLNPRLCGDTQSVESSDRGKGKKEKRSKRVKQAMLQPSSSLNATVEYKTPHYLICSCTTIAGLQLAYGLIDTGQLGVLPLNLKYLKPGQQVTTTVLNTASQFRGSQKGPPVVMVTGTPATDMRLGRTPTVSAAAVLHDVKVGDIISVTVQSVRTTHMTVRYHLWNGRVHCCLATDDVKDGSIAFAGISPGDVVKARVVKFRERQIRGKGTKKGATIDILELTTKPSLLDPSVNIDDVLIKTTFSSGEEVTAFISDVKRSGLKLHLSSKVEATVPLQLISNDIQVLSNLNRHFAEGEALKCTVLGPTEKRSIYRASLIGSVADPSVGDIITGQVRQVVATSQSVVVGIHSGLGRVDITDISDHYLEEPLQRVAGHVGDLVKCYVVGVKGAKVDLSLRASRTGEELPFGLKQGGGAIDPEISSLEDLPEGKVVRGYVKAVTDVGVFVHLGRHVDARVQITHLVDGFVKDFKKIHSVGNLVRGKVLKVDPVKGKVELSLRLSQIDPAAAKKARKEQATMQAAAAPKKKMESTSDGESVDLSSDEEAEESSVETDSEGEERSVVTSRPSLQVTGGFQWDDVPVEADQGRREAERGSSESEEEDEGKEPTSKKSRRQKKAAKKAEEAELYSVEHALLDAGRTPETAEDFDRLLLTHPNSSALWIQYMAFHLHTAEVDKARNIAQRALSTISFREEGEKLNVWVALMNLENLYGSQESLVKVFEQALQQNEPIDVFFRLAAIYEESKKFNLVEQLYQTMTKRFGSNLKVWTQFGQFLMMRGKLEAARNLLQRSLKKLASKQQHVDVISKFAQYEFKHGEPERGRTMFDSLLSSYPKRVDLWSVYVDMVMKLGDNERVRELFEQAVHLKVSAKKMKFIFKRYLEFERQHGSPAGVEAVKEKARAYVEARTSD